MSSEAPAPPTKPFPISPEEMRQFTKKACDDVFDSVTAYEHEKVSTWCTAVIDALLASLVGATKSNETPEGKKTPIKYRFCVNCTILEQAVDEEDKPGSAGKRGMHAAAGAYWDVARDGMWTYKYEGAEDRGIELVLNIAWFATH